MSIFQSHIATFNGRHNSNISKTLIVLYSRKQRGITAGLSAKELHLATGVSYDNLRAKLTKWYNWRYLDRRAVGVDGGRPHYVYTIAERGIHFVEDRIPLDRYNDYITEIKTFRARNKL